MKQQLKCPARSWQIYLIMTVASFCLGRQANAEPLDYTSKIWLAQQNSNPSISNISARELFRKAYENRYTWNPQFPGYTATVEVGQGKENYRGRVRLNADLSVEVTGIDNKDARQMIENQLRMIAIHRRQVPFEAEHKNNIFKLGTTDKNGAVEIMAQGNRTEASYKVLNQQIVQVNRLLGPHSVTVNVVDSQIVPEGYLATQYQTIVREPQTKQIVGRQESKDTYKKIGDYHILSRQVIQNVEQGQSSTTELQFTDINLISAKTTNQN